MSEPRVSVLVTTYNHAPFVEEALESLRVQTAHDVETVIIDDASSDGTGDLIEGWLSRTGYPAKFVRNRENRGICKNRNAGLALSQGELVCSLAGDDAFEPDRIARQVSCFKKQPEGVAAVYSDAVMIDVEGRECSASFLRWSLGEEPLPEGRIFKRVLQHNFLCAPAVMVRRSALAAVGGYDESLAYEDFDMWLRLSYRFEFACLPERVVRYRLAPTSLSRGAAGRKRMRDSDARILEKWLTAALEPDEYRVLLDALWRVGRMHLYLREDAVAGRAFTKIARLDPRWRRRLMGRVLLLPGGRTTARLVASTYRRLRGRPAPG